MGRSKKQEELLLEELSDWEQLAWNLQNGLLFPKEQSHDTRMLTLDMLRSVTLATCLQGQTFHPVLPVLALAVETTMVSQQSVWHVLLKFPWRS